MKRLPLLVTLVLAAALVATAAFAWQGGFAKSPVPASFERQFTATGLVEAVSPGKKGTCNVRVAVYDWISISQGFAIGEVPQESDRYDVMGNGEACQSLTMSMASSSDHISFTIGQAAQSWYFTVPPTPALGCGGLEIDWTPTPL